MIFESLWKSAKKGELILIEGGFCHWHLRQDRQITIREIIATKKGAGSKMLKKLLEIEEATSIFAKCPADLEANKWYKKKGFRKEQESLTKNNRKINHWRLKK